MGVGWIDSIYTNSQTWYLKSVDSSHNGAVTPDGGGSFTLDDGRWHGLTPNKHFHADWCGIPWYYNDIHYKAFTLDQQQWVRFYTSWMDNANWIVFEDGPTGATLARQKAPTVDFHCKLRFTDAGPFLEVVNDDGSTAAVVAYIYNEFKQWVTIGVSALGALLGAKAGGGKKIPAPATPAETESPAPAQ